MQSPSRSSTSLIAILIGLIAPSRYLSVKSQLNCATAISEVSRPEVFQWHIAVTESVNPVVSDECGSRDADLLIGSTLIVV